MGAECASPLLRSQVHLKEKQIDWPTFLKHRIGKILLEGCVIAGRPFQFLGYSMSSLRMRCVTASHPIA